LGPERMGAIAPYFNSKIENGKCFDNSINLEKIERQWFVGYIEILQRMEMWTCANEMIQACPVGEVRDRTKTNTMVYTSCTGCDKALPIEYGAGGEKRGGWWCGRCKNSTSVCTVCHEIVRGMWVWCQGCGHGGHVAHVMDWFKGQRECPACAHLCTYTSVH